MVKTRCFSFIVAIIALSLIIGTWSTPAQASSLGSVSSAEEEEIKSVIQSYFEIRYHIFNNLQLNGFGDVVATSSEAASFSRSELAKLRVQIKHAEQEHLRYVQYQYFLDFNNVSIDAATQTATVSLTEGHNVIFEISKEISPAKPIVSSMRNLDHRIVLRKEQDKWKIISDYYEDYLWRFLNKTGISTNDLLRSMDALQKSASEPVGIQASVVCSLPNDESTHPYDRAGGRSLRP